MTVAIEMGHTTAGAPATLDLEELLATRLLVQGNSGSGKSHLLRRLLEQSAPWVQQTIIDPEGDFVALAERFGHLLIDAEDHTERGLQVAGERARIHRVSTVLNLEGLDAENQMRRAAAFLDGLFEVARDHWYPMLVVVDEAQLFAPAVAGEVSDEARKLSLGAMTNLMCRGRKRGLAGDHRHAATGEARQERRGRGVEFPDGPNLSRHRHGARRRSARHGAAAGGGVPRSGARAVHGAGAGAVPPSAGPAHRPDRHHAAQRDPAPDAAAGSDARTHTPSSWPRRRPRPTGRSAARRRLTFSTS